MAAAVHRFSAQQASFLRALAQGAYSGSMRSAQGVRAVSLVDRMPPVYQQALCGTCVANAVTALLEYYGDCRTQLSVQFLYAATKEVERDGIEANLARLRADEPLDTGFEAVFHAELMQLRMLAGANGGITVPAVLPYLMRFEEGVLSRFATASGSLLMSCFRAVERVGVCRYALWPYAAVPAAPLFGRAGESVHFPPGSREDAAKRRITHGLYLLGTPNNVDEIRGILAGANDRRPMPVAVTVDFFADCDGETYSMPKVETDAEGRLVSKNTWQGRHGLLIVGYEDDASYPGGGFFLIRNSLGEGWGNHGYGKLPYAYLECFALEAGTILQDRIDYEGDGYEGLRPSTTSVGGGVRTNPRGRTWLLNLIVAVLLIGSTIGVGVVFDDPLHLRRKGAGTPLAVNEPETPVLRARLNPMDERVSQRVLFSCRNADERRALRLALANEDVPFAVEFLPQALENVLAVRVTSSKKEDVFVAIMKVLEKHYSGPRREFWTDSAELKRSRSLFVGRPSPRH